VHADVEELRPKLKEILYDCAVDIKATKAALYLFDGTSRYELVTEYGFRGATRHVFDEHDAIVDRCGRGRTPFYINGVGAEPRFSELLFESSTDRLLAAPLYQRGKLIGVIDMRDKAGKLQFDQTDIPKAQTIADKVVALFSEKNIFGHRFIALSRLSGQHEAAIESPSGEPVISAAPPVREKPNVPPPAPPPPAPPAPAAPAVAAPKPPRKDSGAFVPRLATLVIDARNAASNILVPSSSESLSENELTTAREVLRSLLLIPGSVAATFTAFGHMGGVQEIAGRSSVTEEAKNFLQSKFNMWLTKRGEAGGFLRTSVITPFGTTAPPVTANDMTKVFTAPLAVGSLRGLYLTVAFNTVPDRIAHELLAALHNHMQLVLEQSLQRGAIATTRGRIAEKLVEPDFAKFPDLRRHTDAVARLCESFARFLQLTPAEIENARLLGIVHDCGMRLLDYERLYRKKDLSPEELGFLREHTNVGAALVEPLLGVELARALLCHHERVDGRGYPNELHADEIPLLARILQLPDAWVAMTDPGTYQPPMPADAAMATITRSAGSQFDAELAARFVEMLRSQR
jgi:HD domain/GAF domain